MKPARDKVLFAPGLMVITRGARAVLPEGDVLRALRRHVTGDWGEVGEEDAEENVRSVRLGFRVLSVYRSDEDIRFWVITEADRSVTTVLLPEEY